MANPDRQFGEMWCVLRRRAVKHTSECVYDSKLRRRPALNVDSITQWYRAGMK